MQVIAKDNIHTRVTIGLPVYNGGAYIKEAIDSVLRQNYADFQLIVSDNASTDNTWPILLEYSRLDKRVFIQKHEKNEGGLKNQLCLEEKNRSEYFMWFSHDDVMKPDFLKECVNTLDANPSYGMAFTTISNINDKSNQISELTNLVELSGKTTFKSIFKYLMMLEGDGKANLYYSLYRGAVIRSCINNFRFAMQPAWGADMVFILGALILGGGVGISKRNLFSKRVPDGFVDYPNCNWIQNYINKSFRLTEFNEYKNNILKITAKTKYFWLAIIILYCRFFFISAVTFLRRIPVWALRIKHGAKHNLINIPLKKIGACLKWIKSSR